MSLVTASFNEGADNFYDITTTQRDNYSLIFVTQKTQSGKVYAFSKSSGNVLKYIGNISSNISLPTSVAVSNDGKYLAVSNNSGTTNVKLYNIENTSINQLVKTQISTINSGENNYWTSVAFTPDSQTVYFTKNKTLYKRALFGNNNIIEVGTIAQDPEGLAIDPAGMKVALTYSGVYPYKTEYATGATTNDLQSTIKIDSISPDNCVLGETVQVTITGKNFFNNPQFLSVEKINLRTGADVYGLENIIVVSPTEITATIPSSVDKAGVYNLEVKTYIPPGWADTTKLNAFTINFTQPVFAGNADDPNTAGNWSLDAGEANWQWALTPSNQGQTEFSIQEANGTVVGTTNGSATSYLDTGNDYNINIQRKVVVKKGAAETESETASAFTAAHAPYNVKGYYNPETNSVIISWDLGDNPYYTDYNVYKIVPGLNGGTIPFKLGLSQKVQTDHTVDNKKVHGTPKPRPTLSYTDTNVNVTVGSTLTYKVTSLNEPHLDNGVRYETSLNSDAVNGAEDIIIVVGAPVVTKVTPKEIYHEDTTSVTITGYSFEHPNTVVKIVREEAGQIVDQATVAPANLVIHPTSITATINPQNLGLNPENYRVLVENDYGASTNNGTKDDLEIVPGSADPTTEEGVTNIVITKDVNDIVITWDTDPDVTGVDIYTLTRDQDADGNYAEYFTTDATAWGDPVEINYSNDNPYIDAVQIGTGTAKYYKIVATGVAKEGIDFSKQVVGKFDVYLTEGMNLISVPLIGTNTNINTVIGSQLTGGIIPPLSDKVNAYKTDTAGYDQAYLNSNDNNWYDPNTGNESEMAIEADKGFWVEIMAGPPAKNVSVLGKVSETDRGPIAITSGYNLIGSTFPVNVSLVGTNLNEGATAGIIPPLACKINSFKSDKSGYDQAYLNSNDNKWYDPNTGEESTIEFKPGKGYWIEEPNEFDWNYPKPY